MEEVDNIVIHSLKSIGCDISDDISSLKEFPTDLVIESTVRCVRLINNDPNLSFSLPSGMSARYRACSLLANIITEMGYSCDIGYHTFLYSNDVDIRKLFIYLIEKLPRVTAEGSDETQGSRILLYRSVSQRFVDILSHPWLPEYKHTDSMSTLTQDVLSKYQFHATSLAWPHTHNATCHQSKDSHKYMKTHLPLVTEQPPKNRDVAASVVESNSLAYSLHQAWEHEWNTLGLLSNSTIQQYRNNKVSKVEKRISEHVRASLQACETSPHLQQTLQNLSNRTNDVSKSKGSRFTHAEKLQFTRAENGTSSKLIVSDRLSKMDQPTQEEIEEQKRLELERLHEEFVEATKTVEGLERENKTLMVQQLQADDDIVNGSSGNDKKQQEIQVKRSTVDLLPNAEENIDKLQKVIANTKRRMEILADQWEGHRTPLLNQLQELKVVNTHRVSEMAKKLEEMREFREKMKDLANDVKNKEEMHRQLVSEYERTVKDVSRSAYTKKIMEIVANIKKQRDEMAKVLFDTKTVQKEINSLQGKLSRTFLVADELIFKNAKKDESVKRAYKYLAALHSDCDELIETVETTGVILREIRDLNQMVQHEDSKKMATTLERIIKDLEDMKKDNMDLHKTIKTK